jgi:hypothetical protein
MNERTIMTAALTLVAFAIGLRLPDVDLLLGLGHRNGVTHSVAPALVALGRVQWRHAGCGLAGGTGLHLAADCFPNAMTGFATVKLPFAGSIGAAASYGWLAVHAIVALMLAAVGLRRLHHPVAAIGVAAGTAMLGVGYLWRTDGGWPVLAMIMLAAVLWWRRNRAGA